LIYALAQQSASQSAADPLAWLVAGGATLSMFAVILFFLVLFVLGVLLPWFVWRIKVYTKKQYLLQKQWFRIEQQRALNHA
jgi:preprotein translocase subunit Sec63